MRRRFRSAAATLFALGVACGALVAAANWTPAAAGERVRALHARASVPERRGRGAGYFVEFRSRPGYLFGHTYLVYGRLGPRGRPLTQTYAGAYPLDGQRGLIIGSIIPVPSSIRGVKEDYEERPSNVYRIRLSPARYARLRHVIRRISAADRHWNLLFSNCNDFAVQVANGMGMVAPPSWVLPEVFIAGLREFNKP